MLSSHECVMDNPFTSSHLCTNLTQLVSSQAIVSQVVQYVIAPNMDSAVQSSAGMVLMALAEYRSEQVLCVLLL
jgi:hypothetical protein